MDGYLICKLDTNYAYISDLKIDLTYSGTMITRDLKYMITAGSDVLKRIVIDYDNMSYTTVNEKEGINNILPKTSDSLDYHYATMFYLDNSNKYLFIKKVTSSKNANFYVYSVDLEKDSPFELLYSISTLSIDSSYAATCKFKLTSDYKTAYVVDVYDKNYNTVVYETIEDYSEVIALKYNGSYYYKQKQSLSAKATDVKLGKTFIGSIGEIETGTLEV